MIENVILGTGPYGLSVAAHFRQRGIPFRIFGKPMDSWLNHMPRGMMLKSDGFASSLSDPLGHFTLKQFCAETGIEYADQGIPVKLETFSAYGLAFRERLIPELEEQLVTRVERSPGGFSLQVESGETLKTRHLVVAAGITHFGYMPPRLAGLPPEFVSHSFHHCNPELLRGRSVVVVGAGASALDLAGLLHQAGVQVQLVARNRAVYFHDKAPVHEQRSLWQKIRRPDSGLGPGLRSRFFSDWPMVFHGLPQSFRIESVRTHLGPSGGYFTKPMVVGKLPLLLDCAIEQATVEGRKVLLRLRGPEGLREISADHVIAATGYRVDMEKLTFLDPQIRERLALLEGSPVLSSNFESSVPGLFFVGLAAAISFGPVMRFVYGAPFAASRLTRAVERLARLHNVGALPNLGRVRNPGTRPA